MNISISVRSLVEFIFRSGDIADSSNGTLPVEAMNAGSRIHRKLQKRAGSYYSSEVLLQTEYEQGEHVITIQGRADGIINKEEPAICEITEYKAPKNFREFFDDMVLFYEVDYEDKNIMIDEIKGVFKNLDEISEPMRVHVAQAMCYAYIYAKENSLEQIYIRISYVNLDSEKEKFFCRCYSLAYLTGWFDSMMSELVRWLDLVDCHMKNRNKTIDNMEFPFEYRKGQKEMALYVYKTIEQKEHLYVQAPTGIGKTMAAIYPTIKSFVQGEVTKLFYLTAKTVAHTVAKDAINLLSLRGLEFKTVILTAKEKICFQAETDCSASACPYANGHYDRVNDALFDMVSNESMVDREVITSYANKHKVCPFELGLDASLFADGVICDYNYVFDPRASLKRYFAKEGGAPGNYVFLVDEAHNLVDRASSMYSARLVKEDFLQLKKLAEKYSKRLTKYINSCNREFIALKKELPDGGYGILDNLGTLHIKLMSLHQAMELFLEENKEMEDRKLILDFYFKLTAFLNIAELLDENYVIYDELTEDGRFSVRLYCVKPASNIRACLDKGMATVFFSATILPVRYYMEMLSDCPDDKAIYIPSPFDKKNRSIMIARDVTTRYTKRNENQYIRICSYIENLVNSKQGNYMVFFPSYAMLQAVLDMVDKNKLIYDMNMMVQSPDMTEGDREDFLKSFEGEDNILAFCIMGGIFSEGIDLVGDRLIGAVIVGPGLPQVCTERRLMMDFFDKESSDSMLRSDTDGFKYAYQFPGINKVFQAAGRVIRTESDKGIILLLDERFTAQRYTELFPIEWDDYKICSLSNVSSLINSFWNDESPTAPD